MKFLLDAHIPLLLMETLQKRGFDVVHTSSLEFKNETPDKIINLLSIAENRIVITKDTDFFNSYVIKRQPYKLILIRTGNLRLRQFMDLMRSNMDGILQHIEHCSVLELSHSGNITVIF